MATLLTEHHDVLDGAVISLGDRNPVTVLLAGALPTKLPGHERHRGVLVVRYAMPFIYEQDTFYVHRIVDDFGRDFRGAEALDFAYSKGDAFPRATVFGVRASTGAGEETFLKHLDLARPLLPVVYASADDLLPVAQINAAVWLDPALNWQRLETDDARFPAGVIVGVPCYGMPPAELPQLSERLANVRL
jgi:hypothetical protein